MDAGYSAFYDVGLVLGNDIAEKLGKVKQALDEHIAALRQSGIIMEVGKDLRDSLHEVMLAIAAEKANLYHSAVLKK